jgi:hypothetical protein
MLFFFPIFQISNLFPNGQVPSVSPNTTTRLEFPYIKNKGYLEHMSVYSPFIFSNSLGAKKQTIQYTTSEREQVNSYIYERQSGFGSQS